MQVHSAGRVKPILKIDPAKFKSRLEKLTLAKMKKGTRKGMNRLIMAIKAKAVPLAPVKTGNLRHSMHVRTEGYGFSVKGILAATAGYAAFVHWGTGLYGPRKDFIRLGFGFSRGMKGTPFFVLAMEDIGSEKMKDLFLDGFSAATN